MRDVRPDLPVHDVSWSSAAGPPDTVEFGGSPRVSGLLVLGVAGAAMVTAIVLAANHGDDRRTATPTPPPSAVTLPAPIRTIAASPAPAASASALVEGRTTCFSTGSGPGGTVSFGIRNRLARDIVVDRVSFARQPGAAVAATSIGTNRPPSTCPEPKDLHPAAHYRVAPGPVWISVRLTRTPACGTELRSIWVVAFTDRGRPYQMRFSGSGITPDCPPRSHFSHGRYG